jgi:cytochrome c-type biogenesis protein CcmH/NrfG
VTAPGSEGGTSGSASLVLTGLYSVVLGIPLAVLGEATGPYDDPKVWALLILAAATGFAWLVHAWNRPGSAAPARDKRALILRVIILSCVSWWAITTATSIAPLQSLLGSFGRGMGLLTMASAALMFFLVQSECRTPRAVRSIVDIALLGSVPVCLLALGQAGGWDPLPKPWDPAVISLTVRSTFGQHIFLGSYLVVLIPLTAARLEWALHERRESGRWPALGRARWVRGLAGAAWVAGAVGLVSLGSYWPSARWGLVAWGIVGAAAWAFRGHPVGRPADSVLSASLLAGLLAGQVLVVILSRGRGAFVGMLVGLSVVAFAFLVRRRAWKALTAAALGLVALIAFLVLLNLSRSPAVSLDNVGLLSRLSEVADVRHGSPGWFRVQVWRGILDGWSRQLRGEELIPGLSPGMRSVLGYGPETQLLVLDRMVGPFLGVITATGEGEAWRARYVADRAHNVLLEQLVTGGLGGAALWGLLVGSLLVVGISRIRASASPGETTMRLGALGAVLGHVAEGQVGIATAMPLVLFWLGAGLLTSEPWAAAPILSGASPPRVAPRKAWRWGMVLALAALLALLVVLTSTRWLFASVAYAEGVRRGIAGQMADAHRAFQRSVALAPGLPLPAEAAAYTALRLAGKETDPARRRDFLREAAAVLVQARRHATGSVASWTLTAQVALAQARAGDRSKLSESLDAFAAAARLRPDDPQLLAQWSWAWLESGDAARARQTAEQALSRDRREWLAWAVLARSERELGHLAEAERALGAARRLAPPEAGRLLDAIVL